MAGYLIFIPGGDPHHQSRDLLAGVGLGGLCDDDPADMISCPVGPGGLGGVLLSWQTFIGAPRFAFLPESQDWQPINGGAWWFGRQKDCPITPPDVARRKQYVGLPRVLRDGNEWQIPITASLPRTWGLDRDGAFARTVAPEFREYCEMSARVFHALMASADAINAGEAITFELPEAWEYICRALALNYRLSPEIIAALGLIDDSNFVGVLVASTEFDQMQDVVAQKKTADAGTPAT